MTSRVLANLTNWSLQISSNGRGKDTRTSTIDMVRTCKKPRVKNSAKTEIGSRKHKSKVEVMNSRRESRGHRDRKYGSKWSLILDSRLVIKTRGIYQRRGCRACHIYVQRSQKSRLKIFYFMNPKCESHIQNSRFKSQNAELTTFASEELET